MKSASYIESTRGSNSTPPPGTKILKSLIAKWPLLSEWPFLFGGCFGGCWPFTERRPNQSVDSGAFNGRSRWLLRRSVPRPTIYALARGGCLRIAMDHAEQFVPGLFDDPAVAGGGRISTTYAHALLANVRMTNSGSAAMTIRSARAAASGWRRPDSQ